MLTKLILKDRMIINNNIFTIMTTPNNLILILKFQDHNTVFYEIVLPVKYGLRKL